MNELDINGWILWIILTLGSTVFVTRSMWMRLFRVTVLIKLRTPAAYCGGCVGFWFGLVTARWFPLEYTPYDLPYVISALAGMLLGYAFGGATDYEGALVSVEKLRELDQEAGK